MSERNNEFLGIKAMTQIAKGKKGRRERSEEGGR
jgi:hypothetical protein